jgi:hypothetical protein
MNLLSRSVFMSSALIQVITVASDDLNATVTVDVLNDKLRKFCNITSGWPHVKFVVVTPPFNEQKQNVWQL